MHQPFNLFSSSQQLLLADSPDDNLVFQLIEEAGSPIVDTAVSPTADFTLAANIVVAHPQPVAAVQTFKLPQTPVEDYKEGTHVTKSNCAINDCLFAGIDIMTSLSGFGAVPAGAPVQPGDISGSPDRAFVELVEQPAENKLRFR